VIAYRLAAHATPLRAIASRLAGRFNHANEESPTQYLCLHPLGPFAELMRANDLRRLEQVLDVRARTWALEVVTDGLPEVAFGDASDFGVEARDLVADDHGACRELARRLREQVVGLIVPSAALPGTRNVVLFGAHVAVPYQQEPVSAVDIPASVTAEGGRPLSSLVEVVRFRGEPHPALEAWEGGEEFEFREPDWALDRSPPAG
jgi:RES domain-containing protein